MPEVPSTPTEVVPKAPPSSPPELAATKAVWTSEAQHPAGQEAREGLVHCSSRSRRNLLASSTSYDDEDDTERAEEVKAYEDEVKAAVSMRNQFKTMLAVRTSTRSFADESPMGVEKAQRHVRHVVNSPLFEVVIAIFIICHSVIIGVETAESVTHRRQPSYLFALEVFFLLIYSVELAARLFADRFSALKSNWVRFDAALVFFGLTDFFVTVTVSADAMENLEYFMLMRILRISRLARTARLLIQFRTLWMLVQGLMHSILTLLWTFLTAMVICYIFAVLGMEIFKYTLHHPELYDENYYMIVQGSFGTFMDAMLTMVQFLTLDSVEARYRPIVRERPELSIYFVTFLLVVPIALMNLVTAIMVESALKQAKEDQEAQRAWDNQKRRRDLPKLVQLFKELDEDGSGCVELEELRAADGKVKKELMSHCNWGELEDIFNQLDYDSSGRVGIREFCEGLLKAGTDKPVELYCIMRQCCDILTNMKLAVSILENPDGAARVMSPGSRKSQRSLSPAKGSFGGASAA